MRHTAFARVRSPGVLSYHHPGRNAIAERFQVEAPATLIFDHPSVAALASWLAGQLMAAQGGVAAGTASRASQLADSTLAQRDSAQPLAALAGVACSFPAAGGSGEGLPSFWQQAASGVDVQTLIPLCKWDAGKRRDWEFGSGKQPLQSVT